jgi:hypothetical protein
LVENGRKFLHGGRGEATMPDGAAIFETSGAWAAFSTLSRISVCLIAIDVVQDFQIGSRGGRSARRCRRTRASRTSKMNCEMCSHRSLHYGKSRIPASTASAWTLTLKYVIDRATDLEMSYNTNDWSRLCRNRRGSTCKRHASSAQRVNDKVPRAVPRAECRVEMWRGGGRPNSRRGDD